MTVRPFGKSEGREVDVWRATLAGLCAVLVGIGLARFAYTPLIPALIVEGWFSPAAAAYLGAANLAGYLVGALMERPLTGRMSSATASRLMMVLATASFFACALPFSFEWVMLWRLLSGVAGGALMVLAAPSILRHVPVSRRGLAGGAIFAGVGLGIAVLGTLVPWLLRFGLVETWCGLGVLALLLTVVAWGGWPRDDARAPALKTVAAPPRPGAPMALKGLYIEYALNAVALVPHMVFLVDYVARDLGQGIDVGAHYWVLFGLGAVAGPVLAGSMGDRIGFGPAFRLALLVQAIAIGVLVISDRPAALVVSSLVVGAFVPGVVPLALGRVQELVADDPQRRRAWSLCTGAFALGQAGAAYGFSYLFAHGGVAYATLFALGAAALIAALAISLVVQAVASAEKA